MKKDKAYYDQIESLTKVLDEILRRHGASMTPERFNDAYTRLHQAKMAVKKWTKSPKRV